MPKGAALAAPGVPTSRGITTFLYGMARVHPVHRKSAWATSKNSPGLFKSMLAICSLPIWTGDFSISLLLEGYRLNST